MTKTPTNRMPTCVVCGDPINELNEEVPVYIGNEFDFGEYEGEAYHMNECEGEVFESVSCEIEV